MRRISSNIGLRVALFTVALLLALHGRAEAHAALVRAEPAANGRVAAGLTRVRLVFSEAIETGLAKLSLVAGDGRVVPLTVAGDPHDVHAIVADPPPLADGVYRVQWHIVSADGHPVDGSYVFWVGSSQAIAPPVGTSDTPSSVSWGPTVLQAPIVPVAFRAAAVGTLMALAGLLFFLVRCDTKRLPNAPAAERLAILLSGASVIFTTLYIATSILNVAPDHHLGPSNTSASLSSAVGKIELWRLGFVAMVLWALWLVRRRWLALLFAVAALLISGVTGHSAALHPFVAAPAKAIHLLAASLWLGGLLWLLVRPRGDVTTLARDAAVVSGIAVGAVFLVLFSGVAQMLLFLPTPTAIVGSAYGSVALAKMAGLLVLLGFGAYHRYRALPALATAAGADRLHRSVRRELLVMTAVLVLGALLAYIPPPPAASAARSAHSHME